MATETAPRPRAPRAQDRIAAGFLLVLMALGCLAMWIGSPLGSMWVAGELTEEAGTHFLIALPLTLGSMLACATGLFWLNRLYLRITLATALDEDQEDEEERRWMHGPLEPMLVGALIIALVALFVWFFFIAEDPPRQVL